MLRYTYSQSVSYDTVIELKGKTVRLTRLIELKILKGEEFCGRFARTVAALLVARKCLRSVTSASEKLDFANSVGGGERGAQKMS